MTDPRDQVLDALAVYRLSRLVARDSFPPVAAARARWFARHPLSNDELPIPTSVERIDPDEVGRVRVWWTGKLPGLFGGEKEATLTATASAAALDAPDEHPWYAQGTSWGELIECSWCNSFHLSILVLVLRRWLPRYWDPVAKALAFSAVAGFVSQYERD